MNDELNEYLEQEQEHFAGTDYDLDSINTIINEVFDTSEAINQGNSHG